MGFLDKLFGRASAKKPTKDEFASMMGEAIRKAGEKTPFRYDSQDFRLISEGENGHFMNLINVYKEYCATPSEKRATVIRNFTRSWFAHRKECPKNFDEVNPDLLPTIRSRSYYELAKIRLQLKGMPALDWPYQVVAEHYGLGLVYDLPESMMMIQHHQLTEWGVSFEHALDAACKNLAEISQHRFENPSSGVWVSPWRDNHDVARLMLPDLVRQHPVKGDPVALVPNRDTLILTGSADSAGLAKAAALAEKAIEHPRPLLNIPLRLEGDRWVPFLPASNHAQFPAYKMLWIRSLISDYGEQAEALKSLYEKTGEDIFVASFSAVQKKDWAEVFSYCVWSEGLDSLLPKTDKVLFFRASGQDEGDIVAEASWERVQQVAGDMMAKTDLYPERYRVKSFPTDQQLAALGRPD